MIIKYLLKKQSFWTQWYVKINNTKFRQRYSVNQRTNKHTYMHNRIIPNLLRVKTICSTTSKFNKNCDIISKRFKERGCPEDLINEQVDKMKNMNRKQLLSTNKRTIQNRVPVSITYNRYLPNISNIITKNLSILQISPNITIIFKKYLTRSQW